MFRRRCAWITVLVTLLLLGMPRTRGSDQAGESWPSVPGVAAAAHDAALLVPGLTDLRAALLDAWGLAGPVTSRVVAGPRLKVTDAAFAYCAVDEDCGATRVLHLGRDPFKMLMVTRADEALKGDEMQFTFEVSTTEGESIFEYTFDLELRHVPYQRTMLGFRKQPRPLRELEPGPYRFRASAMSSDGTVFSEWTKVVQARR